MCFPGAFLGATDNSLLYEHITNVTTLLMDDERTP